MNISNQIQIIHVPWAVRVLIALLVVGSIGVSVFLFYRALIDGDKNDWIAAGTYLLGVVFPIMIIILIVAGGSFGERSILKRTEAVLKHTIPYHLQFIPEEKQSFKDFRSQRRSAQTPIDQLATIAMHHTTGRCYADYIVTIPDPSGQLKLNMRVELNIKRVNINVVFDATRLSEMMARENFGGEVNDFLRQKFRHSLAVEEIQSRDLAQGDFEKSGTIAYAFNPEFLSRSIDGRDNLVVVASTRVADDLVWNPSEKVFFAQDLMFMIRAFLQENPAMFREGEAVA